MKEAQTSIVKKPAVVLLYAILLLCTFTMFDFTGAVQFAFGYYISNFFLFIPIVGLVGLCFIFVLIISIVELILTWIKNVKNQSVAKSFAIRGVILTAVVIYVTVVVVFRLIPENAFHKGFYARVKETVNIEEVRGWLDGLDEEMFNKELSFHPEKTDFINVPEEFFDLKPNTPYIKLFRDDKGCQCADLQWGGVFARWGIVIGPKTMQVPPSDTEVAGRYRYKIEEGIYSWEEI